MKLILSILAFVLVSVEAQNVSCNYTPSSKSVIIDIIPIKDLRTFGEQTNRENWCVGHCADCNSVRAQSVFNFANQQVLAQKRVVIQQSDDYSYCQDQSISDIVETAVNNYNTIDEMTSYLKQHLNKAGWAYLFMEQSHTTGTVSTVLPVDKNFCYMQLSKFVPGSADRRFGLYSGLVKA
ncbi:unnamed protein product [Auanema sp. JU1783]|nr:unnamed protein product [Auanema sp. JU1783]